MQSLGTRIRTLRGALTQRAFAESLGVTSQAIINYEKYGRIPNSKVLNKIKNIYNISPDWLLTGNGAMYLKSDSQEEIVSKTADMSAVLKDKNSRSIEFTDNINLKTADTSAVFHLAEQNITLQREFLDITRQNADLLRQNGDLRVEIERQKARIAELERQLAEALKPQERPPVLGERSAAAG